MPRWFSVSAGRLKWPIWKNKHLKLHKKHSMKYCQRIELHTRICMYEWMQVCCKQKKVRHLTKAKTKKKARKIKKKLWQLKNRLTKYWTKKYLNRKKWKALKFHWSCMRFRTLNSHNCLKARQQKIENWAARDYQNWPLFK